MPNKYFTLVDRGVKLTQIAPMRGCAVEAGTNHVCHAGKGLPCGFVTTYLERVVKFLLAYSFGQ